MPLTDQDFEALMAPFGPFEKAPRIAMGISGGTDSMTLAYLASRWAVSRGGQAIALTVDHGLRPEATAEAKQVGSWMASMDIPHRILTWEGLKPKSAIQEEARRARYSLLTEACKQEGILHLLVAHTQEDQVETMLLRMTMGSGPFGLSAMPTVREMSHGRLLRPLLTIPREEVHATGRAAKLPWIEDPSNVSFAFARVRLRFMLKSLVAEGLSIDALTITATRCALSRHTTEVFMAEFLAKHVAIYPEGWAVVDKEILKSQPLDLALRILSQIIETVGGIEYPARHISAQQTLTACLESGAKTRTLGGCLLIPHKQHQLLICRESPVVPPLSSIKLGDEMVWDHRFRVRYLSGPQTSLTLQPLGDEGWAMIKKEAEEEKPKLPATVRRMLPSLWDNQKIVAVPHLNWAKSPEYQAAAVFAPAHPLAGPSFGIL